ncbi:Cysteine-rich receptor-like protein kinase 25, partial [Cucurbita argyrosperma subsp. sororia]
MLTYAWKLWKNGTSLELLDPILRDNYSRNEVLRCIHIALLCVQEDPSRRPSMTSIVLMLNSYSTTLPLPREPASFMHSKDGGIAVDNLFNMFSYLTFLFHILLCFFIHGNAQTSDPYTFHSCLPDNFTKNTAYQSSLDLLSNDFPTIAAVKTFYSTSFGQPPDSVYGLFQCRGDVNSTICENCVAEAARNIPLFCPLSKGALFWFDECIFRYSNNPFFSQLSINVSFALLNTADIDVDKARFNELVMSLLTDTGDRAADNALVNGSFATQVVNFTSDVTLYALAQCTGDLSTQSCRECLANVIETIPICCTNKLGGRALFPSCYVRYEVYQFFNLEVQPPATPTPPLLPPPPSPPPPPPGIFRPLDSFC